MLQFLHLIAEHGQTKTDLLHPFTDLVEIKRGTHDPRLAATCDRRVTLADGQIVADER